MADWTPPPSGTPCWVEIPATDVPRAKAFYGTVFNWTFRTNHPKPEAELAAFHFPSMSLDGGIVKRDEIVQSKGGPRMYLYVENLEAKMDDIVKHGGKKCGDIEPEGEFGIYMLCEDTEGNPLAIYTMKK